MCRCPLILVVVLVTACQQSDAADWSRFRGPNGTGMGESASPIPTEWSDEKNLQWRADLPGPGSSSPIVVGGKVFVTSWSGYADGDDQGSMEDLKRHLVCIDRQSGKQEWDSTVDAALPEDSYRGMFAENGYATHTPASDGERVYVFFGKSGVHAFDMTGKHLWKADVGSGRDRRGWGSSSSPIVYKNLVIVMASPESQSLIALDKTTGKEVWKQRADGFASTWGTPILDVGKDRTDLVVAVPFEIWGINPDNGKLRWYCEAIGSSSMCSSVVAQDGMIYGIETGPGGGGAVAVMGGGKGDVTKSNIVWSNNERSRVATPIIHNQRMYWVTSGVVNCADAKTGKRVYQSRLSGSGQTGGSSQGGRFGSRGGRGGQDYSSPVVADDKMYFARRGGDVFVVQLGDEFKQIARNRFASSAGDFHATPAISDGQIFIRSSKSVYCVAEGAAPAE